MSADSLNSLTRTVGAGQPILGYLVTTPSVQLVQALARSGAGLISGAAQRMVQAIRT